MKASVCWLTGVTHHQGAGAHACVHAPIKKDVQQKVLVRAGKAQRSLMCGGMELPRALQALLVPAKDKVSLQIAAPLLHPEKKIKAAKVVPRALRCRPLGNSASKNVLPLEPPRFGLCLWWHRGHHKHYPKNTAIVKPDNLTDNFIFKAHSFFIFVLSYVIQCFLNCGFLLRLFLHLDRLALVRTLRHNIGPT